VNTHPRKEISMTSQQKITRYTFDNDWHAERKRLSALEAWLDPGTIRHLEACGVGQGWQCLEVAAGGALLQPGSANG
jgi:hypothetical protein